jgi:hypothetical protein
MSCCSSKSCPHNYASWFPRIGFGLVLVGYGVNHYRSLDAFIGMASGVFTVPALASVMTLLAYVVPALMIVGGALFAVKQFGCWSKFCILASLGGILGWGGLAIMLGTMQTAMDIGPAVQNAALLIVVYYIIKKMSCCGSSSGCCTPSK